MQYVCITGLARQFDWISDKLCRIIVTNHSNALLLFMVQNNRTLFSLFLRYSVQGYEMPLMIGTTGPLSRVR